MTRIPIDDNNDMQQESEQNGDDPKPTIDDFNKLRQERDDLFERLARTTADYKNSQKRMETEMDQRLQFANGLLIKSLLPVIDNFERALTQDATKVDAATILKGMQMVHDQFLSVFKQQKVDEIAPKPGDKFDPNLHQALLQQPGDYNEPTVTQLLQKGYSMQQRTLRPAQVAVSKIE